MAVERNRPMPLTETEDNFFRLISTRWTAHILLALHAYHAPCRFRDILEYVPGLSNRMLSARLASLEDEMLVARSVASTRPVSVIYELTPAGEAVAKTLALLRQQLSQRPLSTSRLMPATSRIVE